MRERLEGVLFGWFAGLHFAFGSIGRLWHGVGLASLAMTCILQRPIAN